MVVVAPVQIICLNNHLLLIPICHHHLSPIQTTSWLKLAVGLTIRCPKRITNRGKLFEWLLYDYKISSHSVFYIYFNCFNIILIFNYRTSSSSSSRGQPTEELPAPSTSSANIAPPTTTTVVYNFNDEEFPFRKKIAGYPITLKQFIECMPKKGHYRYIFHNLIEYILVLFT